MTRNDPLPDDNLGYMKPVFAILILLASFGPRAHGDLVDQISANCSNQSNYVMANLVDLINTAPPGGRLRHVLSLRMRIANCVSDIIFYDKHFGATLKFVNIRDAAYAGPIRSLLKFETSLNFRRQDSQSMPAGANAALDGLYLVIRSFNEHLRKQSPDTIGKWSTGRFFFLTHQSALANGQNPVWLEPGPAPTLSDPSIPAGMR